MSVKVQMHREIVDNLNAIYASKNSDYGDSFAIVRRRHTDAILVRLWDKLLRLETLLCGGDQKVKDESIDDTLTDLANYAIMELVEREIEKNETPVEEPCAFCFSEDQCVVGGGI